MARFLKLIAALSLLLPSITFGAVSFDNTDTACAGGGVTDVTISNFAVAATNPLILAGVAEDDGLATTSSVTFNAISFTQIGTDLEAGLGYDLGLWRLTANSGTHDIVATFSGVVASAACIGVMSFNGADQSSPVGTRQDSTDYDGAGVNVTVLTDGMAADFIAAIHQTDVCTTALNVKAAGNTERFEDCSTSGGGVHIAGSTRSTSGVLSWGLAGGEYGFQLGIAVNPVSAATPHRKTPIIIQ